ncbi:hypothetical protein HY494_01210 [Candidatus Woesearchaeota archaeon]|nr:hypothetical protein [Candidatus Woesearchaeota archaeon]
MGLDTILLGITGTLALYATIDSERRAHIEAVTDNLIADSCRKRTDNLPLNLPPKLSYAVTGVDSYQAKRRYEIVYSVLLEKGDTADSRELLKLFDVK